MKRLFTLIGMVCCVVWGAAQDMVSHSKLAEGRWVKIRVPATGIYELTDSMLQAAGFSDPERVAVYGYGGARQPEVLVKSYLAATSDLPQVTVAQVNGHRLFHAVGPVNWETAETEMRERNNYSSYGYYFLTDSGEEENQLCDSANFVSLFYPAPEDYHSLYEVDNFSWFNGGRQLFESEKLPLNIDRNYKLLAGGPNGVLTVGMTYNDYCDAEVLVNDSLVGNILIDKTTTTGRNKRPYLDNNNPYYKAMLDYWTFPIPSGLTDTTTVTLRKKSGADMRLDYISLRTLAPRPLKPLSATAWPVPEVVGEVANQDLHGDEPVDMVIIIPTNRQIEADALRLKELHETKDGLRVKVVAADELYNEFSSGTPDANAYRRYLRMHYDRATTASDKPRYLLLFGDGAWDNRMLVSDWSTASVDDFLLTYESDNSFSETLSYSCDDYFCMLDDGEGSDLVTADKADVAVGRLPARTAAEAKIMADKTISYRLNEKAGDWQNTLCFMADDGNENLHMQDAEYVIDSAAIDRTPYRLKKIYWDAYPEVTTATGNEYPDVRKLVRQQMQQGALIMNYTGHGSPYKLSHELCIVMNDFNIDADGRLPLWFIAACDITPFNTQETNQGEVALKNPTGGAVGVISTVHTVYAMQNRILNKCLMRRLLGTGTDGKCYPIGEALRLAKQAIFYERRSGEGIPRSDRPNHLQYILLGDPALRLNVPDAEAVIDRINGNEVEEGVIHRLVAGEEVTVEGSLPGHDDFQGVTTLTVADAEMTVKGKVNNREETKRPYSWRDRPNIVNHVVDSVKDGRFKFTFVVPKDISYSDNTGLFYVWAVNEDHTLIAHGSNGDFIMGDTSVPWEEGEGPSVVCYLDSPFFTDGDQVGPSPVFYAQISSPNGISPMGGSVGHDMELIIDGRLLSTYVVNDYFEETLGDYHSGKVEFRIPTLELGDHTLLFRVWDVLNNSSSVALSFVVVEKDPMEHGSLGIRDAAGTIERGRHNLYDSSGRRMNSSPRRRGIYIYRDQQGVVKKMMAGGQ